MTCDSSTTPSLTTLSGLIWGGSNLNILRTLNSPPVSMLGRAYVGHNDIFETSLAGTLMIRGSCLCGGVKYEIAGSMENPLNCHSSSAEKHRARLSARGLA